LIVEGSVGPGLDRKQEPRPRLEWRFIAFKKDGPALLTFFPVSLGLFSIS
jgi:hypothetical protein